MRVISSACLFSFEGLDFEVDNTKCNADKGLAGRRACVVIGRITRVIAVESISPALTRPSPLQIPKDISPGEYVLSWRWDCELTAQGELGEGFIYISVYI